MNMQVWTGWQSQAPAIGGGIVRKFEKIPDGEMQLAGVAFKEATGAVQWLEGINEDYEVRATVFVAGQSGWSRECALAAVFDSFIEKIR